METVRPTERDPEVIKMAVDKLLPEVIEWLGEDPVSEAEIREQITESIHSFDGYRFARELNNRYGWDPDSELVEILDCADTYLFNAHHKIVEKWVAAYQVFAGSSIGAIVTYRNHMCEITGSNDKRGTYNVFSPEEGHVREGTGTHSYIVPWEQIDGKVNCRGLTVAGPLFAEVTK